MPGSTKHQYENMPHPVWGHIMAVEYGGAVYTWCDGGRHMFWRCTSPQVTSGWREEYAVGPPGHPCRGREGFRISYAPAFCTK